MELSKEFWVTRLGEGWTMRLRKTLKSKYMQKLMSYISTQYKDTLVYPAKQDVFKAFKDTPWEDLKVVILGQAPYHTEKSATGLAYGNRFDVVGYSPELIKIYEQVETDFYDGLCLDFDWSMWRWAQQGVLMLNTTLTTPHDSPSFHSEPWAEFTQSVISTINDEYTGIVFLLWGSDAKKYNKLIGDQHHVLTYEHPSHAVRKRKDWKCPHFVETNKILNDKYGEEIKW